MNGGLIRKTGIMSIVLTGGHIVPGDNIHIDYHRSHIVPLTESKLLTTAECLRRKTRHV